MRFHPSRRAVLAAAAALVTPVQSRAESGSTASAIRNAQTQIAALESRDGGRLGVAILDTGGDLNLGHRQEERFPMCSTFKLLAVSAVLKRVDQGTERLDRMIPYGAADLLNYAPVAKAHVDEGGMTLGGLCAAAIEWSDNTAANLLLRVIGGPDGFTRYARSLGDEITRLDRDEPGLNTAIPGDDRDTTSPQAMLRNMRSILLGQELSPASRGHLELWLVQDKVGAKRLRAGYGLTANDVTAALSANNVIAGIGNTKGQMVQYNLTASTNLHSLDGFRNLVIKQVNGGIIRLSDVANVTLGSDDYESGVEYNGKKGVYIGIQTVPSASLLAVIAGVKAVLPSVQRQLPCLLYTSRCV